MSEFNYVSTFKNAWSDGLKRASSNLEWRTGGRKSKAYPNGEDTDWWNTHGPDMVLNWIKWRTDSGYVMADVNGHPAIELELVGEIGGVPIRAFIDRLMVNRDGEYVIVDLKTGSREPGSKTQLGVYSLLLKKCLNIDVKYGAYWMARTGELSELYEIDNYTEDVLGNWLRAFEKAVVNDIFIPNTSALCKSCGVNYACYMYNKDAVNKFPPIQVEKEENNNVSQ